MFATNHTVNIENYRAYLHPEREWCEAKCVAILICEKNILNCSEILQVGLISLKQVSESIYFTTKYNPVSRDGCIGIQGFSRGSSE